MRVIHHALVEGDPETGFSAYFPDFPGCTTGGDSLEELFNSAIEALELYTADMIEDGEAIPEPSRDFVFDPDHEGPHLAIAVPLEVEGPTGRYNVTLPRALVKQIDSRFPNRSRFLTEAARERLRKNA